MPFDFKSIYRNITLVIGIAILVIGGLGFYFLRPQYDALRQVQSNIQAEEANLLQRQKDLADMNKLLKDYEGVKAQLYDLSLALPSEKDVPNLLVQLEALATKNGMLMETINYSEEEEEGKKGSKKATPSPKTEDTSAEAAAEAEGVPQVPQKGYSTLNVELALKGNYDSFMKYVEDVQRNFRFLDISEISFDVGEGKESKSGEQSKQEVSFEDKTFSFAVKLRTYYLK